MKAPYRLVSILASAVMVFGLVALVAGPTPAQAQDVQVLSADPPSATQGTVNLNVLIKGKGFKRGAIAKFLVTGTADPGGVKVNSTTFVGSTSLIANIDVADAAILSKYDIQVMLSDGRGGKGTELFSVTKKTDPSCSVPPPVPDGGYCISGIPGMPGCLDSNFGNGTGRVLDVPRSLRIKGLAIQTFSLEDTLVERIVAAGEIDYFGVDPCVASEGAIARYDANGTLDTTFGVGGIVRGIPLGLGGILGSGLIAVQPDNKLVAVGQASVQMPAPRGQKPITVKVPAVVRYHPNGSVDTSFGNAGLATVPLGTTGGYLTAVAVQADGKIVATGAYGGKLAVIRLNPNGTSDTTFNGTGRFVYSTNASEGNAITTQFVGPEERVVVAGQMIKTYAYWSAAVVRLTSAGALDHTFGDAGLVLADHPPLPDGAYNGGEFYGVAVDSSNRIVAAGSLSNYALQMARYDASGNLDLTFGDGGFVLPPNRLSSEFANGITIQADGYILTVGTSRQDTETSSRPFLTVRRFTPDGAPDLSFGDGGWVIESYLTANGSSHGNAMVQLSDGRLVAAGDGPSSGSYWGTALACFWK